MNSVQWQNISVYHHRVSGTIHAENKISSMHPRKVLVRRIWPCLHVCSSHSQCQTRCADCPPLGYNRTSWAWSLPLLVYTIKQSVDIPADMKCRRLGTHGMPALGRVNCIGGRWCPQQYKTNTTNGSSGGHERRFSRNHPPVMSWFSRNPPVMRDGSAQIILRSWESVQQKSSSGHERRFSRNHPPVMTDGSAETILRLWETVQQKSSSGHERRFSRNHPPVMRYPSCAISPNWYT